MRRHILVGLALALGAAGLGSSQASAGGWRDCNCGGPYGYYAPPQAYGYQAYGYYAPPPTYSYYMPPPVYYVPPPISTYTYYGYNPSFYGGYYGNVGWRRW
jgi:hypothetical protein